MTQITIGPQTLTGTPQSLTAAWVDIGDEMPTQGMRWIALWAELTINDSENARIRLVGRHATGGNDYPVPVLTIGAAAVGVQAAYYEFSLDTDQNLPLDWELRGLYPFSQFQIQAGTVGATAGQVTSAVVTMWS